MDWMDIPVEFKHGNYAYVAKKEKVEYLDSQSGISFPNAREWSPEDEDWKLPEDWKDIMRVTLSAGALSQTVIARFDGQTSVEVALNC